MSAIGTTVLVAFFYSVNMSWWNPFSWNLGTRTRFVVHGTPEFSEFTDCFGGGHTEENLLTLFKSLPEVFAPIDGIASRVKNGRFQVKRISNDEVVYSKLELNKLLMQPNPFQKWEDFIYNAVVYKYVCGNRYIYAKCPKSMSFSYKNITGLWLLMPQYTQITPKEYYPNIFDATSKSDIVKSYDTTWCGRTVSIDPAFVMHDTALNVDINDQPGSPLKGTSPLIVDKYPISNLIAVYTARNVIYTKKGALGALVSKKGDASGLVALTSTEKKRLQDDFQSSYGLTHEKGQVVITDVPVEFIRFAMSISELQPFDETRASMYAIAATLKYPRSLLPDKDAPKYLSGPNDERSLYQNTIINEGKEICQILNGLLSLEESGLYIDVSYDHIDVLQEDKKAAADVFLKKSQTVISLYDKGFITKNRGLVLLGEEEVAGFDVYSFNDPENDNNTEGDTPDTL